MSGERPVRVLHVLPSMSFRGGMISVVMNYHHAIDADKVLFDYLYVRPPDDRADEARGLGARVWQVPFSPRPAGVSAVHRFFAQHAGEFDIVHCHQIFAPEIVGWPAKKYGARRIISHSHATRFSDKFSSAIRNRFITLFVSLFATDYVACSDAARVLLGKHGKKAYIMHNAIDCASFKFDEVARGQVRSELGICNSTLLLGTLGRLEPQKNHVFLPEVVRAITDRGVDCLLVIAGSGSLRDQIISRATELNVANRVRLIGDRSDAPRLYSALDVFLLPSLFEGLPVSGVEAQVSGLPCVFSSSVTPEVAFGECRFAPIDDVEAWANAIMALPRDAPRNDGPGLARKAGFDITVEADRLADHYRAMLGW